MVQNTLMTTQLYTMQALARKMGTSYGYMRQLMLRVKKGELSTWRGFRFLVIGDGKRSTWLAHPEKQKVQLIDENSVFAQPDNDEG